jgi:hypothetical protein
MDYREDRLRHDDDDDDDDDEIAVDGVCVALPVLAPCPFISSRTTSK